ncbi:hypothetical protein JCM1840_005067 [Sporobolomyces johnsonii]
MHSLPKPTEHQGSNEPSAAPHGRELEARQSLSPSTAPHASGSPLPPTDSAEPASSSPSVHYPPGSSQPPNVPVPVSSSPPSTTQASESHTPPTVFAPPPLSPSSVPYLTGPPEPPSVAAPPRLPITTPRPFRSRLPPSVLGLGLYSARIQPRLPSSSSAPPLQPAFGHGLHQRQIAQTGHQLAHQTPTRDTDLECERQAYQARKADKMARDCWPTRPTVIVSPYTPTRPAVILYLFTPTVYVASEDLPPAWSSSL